MALSFSSQETIVGFYAEDEFARQNVAFGLSFNLPQ